MASKPALMASKPRRRGAFEVGGLLTLILFLAEGSGLVVGVVPAAILELVVAVALLALFAWRTNAAAAPLLPALALAFLIRPVSLAAVAPAAPRLGWYVLAGLPLLLGGLLALRLVDTPGKRHLRIRRPRLDLAVVAAGPILGVLGYLALRPSPLFSSGSIPEMAALVVVMGLFGGLTEELIFRGSVLDAALVTMVNGRSAVVFAAVLPAALYIGSGSVSYPILIALSGLGFGSALLRGGSIWAVSASHGLMLAVMGVLAQLWTH